CNIGAWVDQLLGRGRYPVGEFLWRECIPDIEYADTGNVIGREDCFLTLKSPRTVLMQVVRAERSESTEVSFLRCRQRTDRNGIFLGAQIHDERAKHALRAFFCVRFVGDHGKLSAGQGKRRMCATRKRRAPVYVRN